MDDADQQLHRNHAAERRGAAPQIRLALTGQSRYRRYRQKTRFATGLGRPTAHPSAGFVVRPEYEVVNQELRTALKQAVKGYATGVYRSHASSLVSPLRDDQQRGNRKQSLRWWQLQMCRDCEVPYQHHMSGKVFAGPPTRRYRKPNWCHY
jgi:hypothetical protein